MMRNVDFVVGNGTFEQNNEIFRYLATVDG